MNIFTLTRKFVTSLMVKDMRMYLSRIAKLMARFVTKARDGSVFSSKKVTCTFCLRACTIGFQSLKRIISGLYDYSRICLNGRPTRGVSMEMTWRLGDNTWRVLEYHSRKFIALSRCRLMMFVCQCVDRIETPHGLRNLDDKFDQI